jgi:hypothetical protein
MNMGPVTSSPDAGKAYGFSSPGLAGPGQGNTAIKHNAARSMTMSGRVVVPPLRTWIGLAGWGRVAPGYKVITQLSDR